MPDTPMHNAATVDDGFEAAVEQFLREREAGSNPDRQRYLESFPQFTSELGDFFAGQDLFDRLAPDLAPNRCARPAAIPSAIPTPGEQVGGFELIEELGRGGMGVVYRAQQTKLDRIVAVKMIRSQDEAELARFRVESEAIARLQHANIVQLFEVGEHDGSPFFAMEYCAGGSLEQRLRGTALLPAEAAVIVASLARAMQAAHQQNVIHRDLKPANVMLAGGNAATPLSRLTPKVTDFGLARKLDDPGLTQSGVIMGTPSYLAPEQASGRSRAVGPAADIYALGAVLYECLTGRPPFRAATTLDTLAQVLDTDPVPPRQLNPAVPRDLETVCLKCLHKEPRRRYADAAALADDLDRYRAGRPVQARRVGLAERVLRWARRRPAAAGLAAAVILLAAGAGVAGWWYQQEQLDQASRQAKEDVRKAYVTEEVTAALDRSEVGLKELHQALKQLLPDENHPLAVSVLLSDLRHWEVRVQSAKGMYLQATKLSESNPEALAPEQQARLKQLGVLVEQAEADYQIARQLDRIRLEAATIVDGKYDEGRAGPAYEKVFREQLHLDLRDGPLPQLAEQIRGSPLRYVLAAALDHWADVATEDTLRLRLLEVARLADPDPWRDQVRDQNTWQNVPKMQHLAGTVQPAEQTPQILMLLARRLAFKGARQEAAAFLRMVLVHYPADFWLNFELGWRSDNLDEQLGSYRAALAVRPDSALVLNNLGFTQRRKKEVVGAITCFVKALELARGFSVAHNNLIGTLDENGNVDGASAEHVDRAIASYRKHLDRHPSAERYYHLAKRLFARHDYDGEVACLEAARKCDPKFAWAHHDLGFILHVRKNDLDGAIACYREALKHDPRNALFLTNLGFALQRKPDLKGAIARYEEALKYDPTFSTAHYNLGVALRDKGDLIGAIFHFKKDLENSGTSPNARANLAHVLNVKAKALHDEALALRDKKDVDGAMACFEQVLEKDVDVAIDCFNKVLELDPNDALALCSLGLARRAKGQVDEAIDCYRKAIEMDSNFALAHRALGQALLGKGRFAEGRDALARAVSLLPANHPLRGPTAKQVEDCTELLQLEKRLPGVLSGEDRPDCPGQVLSLAWMCRLKGLHAAATRLAVGAFADPQLDANLASVHRYNLACSAALAAAGQGEDADKLSDMEKSQMRQHALTWLRAELTDLATKLKADRRQAADAQHKLQWWQTDPALADVRDEKPLAQLPEGERKDWQTLWADVARVLKTAQD
jgi:serine/threonine-protein kinase